jgi:uncharacterized NAD-dependent epimerase/dehydratase family protein
MNENKEKFPTVPLKEGEGLTHNWRKFYYSGIIDPENTTPNVENGTDVFRGFRIPLEDLTNIVAVATKYNNEILDRKSLESPIKAVRIYLAKGSPAKNIQGDVHVLMVPVAGGEDTGIKSASASDQNNGKDLLTIDGQSAIYDFSTPCPDQCDTTSALYK